ncbi:MAG: c-type cytochrome biogenesis protein CcmI [Oceanobacter sp.]
MIWMLLILLLPLAVLMVRPVWFAGTGRAQSEDNLALYKERSEELKTADLEPDEREALQLELDREFLAQSAGSDSDGASTKNSGAAPRSSIGLFALVLVFTSVLTVVLYNFWGAQNELAAAALLEKGRQVELTDPERQTLMSSLASAAQRDPENLEWAYLNARILSADGQFSAAASAFEQILEQLPEEASRDRAATLTLLAEARFYQGDQKPDATVYQLLVKALELEPANRQTLGMAGIMAFELGKPAEAINHWRMLWQGLPEGPETRMLEQGIRRAAEVAAEAGTEIDLSWLDKTEPEPQVASQAGIKVRVTLSDQAKAAVSANDTVFVLARAVEGPPMPLAAQRLTVADLPADITLSDAQAMMAGMSISQFPSLTVVARVSKSGQPIAAPGDWQALKSPVSNQESELIELVIAELVE